MKTPVQFGLIAVAALLIGTQASFSADTTPPAQAMPGTPPATDTKTQENNPGGPTSQTTAAVPPNTKDVQNVPAGAAPMGNKSGAGSKSSKKHHKHKKTTDSGSDSGMGTNTKPDKQ